MVTPQDQTPQEDQPQNDTSRKRSRRAYQKIDPETESLSGEDGGQALYGLGARKPRKPKKPKQKRVSQQHGELVAEPVEEDTPKTAKAEKAADAGGSPPTEEITVHPEEPEQAETPQTTQEPAEPGNALVVRQDKTPPKEQGPVAQRANSLVNRYTAISAGLGLIPVPLLDLAAVSAVQLRMLAELTELYDVPFSSKEGKAILASLTGGLASSVLGRKTMLNIVSWIPVIGNLMSVTAVPLFAGASTYAIGQVFIREFSKGQGMNFDMESAREFLVDRYEHAKEVVKDITKVEKVG